MPRIVSSAKRLRIYIGETDRWSRKSLYHAIVLKAKELGLASATVFRGIMGYGADGRVRTARIVDLPINLPILIEITDSEKNINKLMPFLDEMMNIGVVMIDNIEIIYYQ
ncbi:DUF190 domain-containing protein [Pelosinus fermentans]|uniref:Uncharacterized protein n=1 Tax=Pelosinus fermentans B4 TaxID=1149862 RepID=I9AUM3_9FIRM|nr:DUF190 domain-containing protein [Pelosinus fermentans]EIW16647.1 protein of unknown function DUF190 [Pelosinus fermentans B4]EIW22864.1 protein of unknown function DUF190 [Pelosinus fermentans A11]